MLKSEILFVDPAVSDIATILGGLRPEVEAIVLDSSRPAARQIAAALRGRRGLDAVHVIAHGAAGPGELRGRRMVGRDAFRATPSDLAAIGRALGEDGELRLWSCDVAAGASGEASSTRSRKRRARDVAAARGRVGAAALGGTWELRDAARDATRPPLTAAGAGGLSGVLGFISDFRQDAPNGPSDSSKSTTYFVRDRSRNVSSAASSLPDASRSATVVQLNVNVPHAWTASTLGPLTTSGTFVPARLSRSKRELPRRPLGRHDEGRRVLEHGHTSDRPALVAGLFGRLESLTIPEPSLEPYRSP